MLVSVVVRKYKSSTTQYCVARRKELLNVSYVSIVSDKLNQSITQFYKLRINLFDLATFYLMKS